MQNKMHAVHESGFHEVGIVIKTDSGIHRQILIKHYILGSTKISIPSGIR
jgi:hypothetical protein